MTEKLKNGAVYIGLVIYTTNDEVFEQRPRVCIGILNIHSAVTMAEA
jgi:hypothetical protein